MWGNLIILIIIDGPMYYCILFDVARSKSILNVHNIRITCVVCNITFTNIFSKTVHNRTVIIYFAVPTQGIIGGWTPPLPCQVSPHSAYSLTMMYSSCCCCPLTLAGVRSSIFPLVVQQPEYPSELLMCGVHVRSMLVLPLVTECIETIDILLFL